MRAIILRTQIEKTEALIAVTTDVAEKYELCIHREMLLAELNETK